MNIIDSIQADTIEVGDQILVDSDPIEVTAIRDDENDGYAVIVSGYSHESGDKVEYTLPFDYDVELWAV